MQPDVIDVSVVESDLPAAPDAKRAARLSKGFRPSKAQRAYLEAWLDPKMPKTVVGIAEATGIARSNVYYWLRNDQFVQWFDAEMDRHTEHQWKPVLSRLAQLALAGSVEHAKLLAQIRGAIQRDDAPQRGGVTVVVGIPRAGDPQVLPAEPRPSLPAPTSEREH